MRPTFLGLADLYNFSNFVFLLMNILTRAAAEGKLLTSYGYDLEGGERAEQLLCDHLNHTYHF